MILFSVLAGLLIVSSVLVILQRNVVHSALALVAALFLNAVFFLTLDAPMVGILQVLVYAGAVMVLFLFVIMLLNPGVLESRRLLWWGSGAVGSLLLMFLLVGLVGGSPDSAESIRRSEAFGSPEMLGQSLFTDFVLPFEIASILLIVAIIGAVVLAKKEV